MEKIELQLHQNSIAFEEAVREYYEAETEYESKKKMAECSLAAIIQAQDCTTQAEKKQKGIATPEYNQIVLELNLALSKRNMARAKKEGVECKWKTVQSIMSYRKTLVDKGIYNEQK